MTNFWKGRRVLVTGGHGFLGTYVRMGLTARGAKYDAPGRFEFDLRDPSAIEAMLRITQPDVIIHLAAVVGGIGANQERPAEFLYDNLMMGAQLIDAAWRAGIEKFVTVGTVCAYPKFTPAPFKEDDLWNGYPEETNAPYGLAKKMLLVQGQAYRQQYGFNSIYLLPTNLYGPYDDFGDSTSHVIPALIKRFDAAKAAQADFVTAWGDGTPTREFLHAADAAEGILLATERYDGAEPVNLGGGIEISIRSLSEKIASVVGYMGYIDWDASKPNGQPRRLLDTRRAREAFGFEARTPFDKGLRETVEWYVNQRADGHLEAAPRPANTVSV
jgi:GDP-L-fucose synthase